MLSDLDDISDLAVNIRKIWEGHETLLLKMVVGLAGTEYCNGVTFHKLWQTVFVTVCYLVLLVSNVTSTTK